MSIWRRQPIDIQEVNRGEIVDKEVSVEVGYSESFTYGMDWGNENRDSSDFTSLTSTSHYQYQNRPHQQVQYLHIFRCLHCKKKIGVRRWKELRLE